MLKAIAHLRTLAEVHAAPETARAIMQVELNFVLGSQAAAATLEDLISHPESARLREIAMDLHELAEMAQFFAREAWEISERMP